MAVAAGNVNWMLWNEPQLVFIILDTIGYAPQKTSQTAPLAANWMANQIQICLLKLRPLDYCKSLSAFQPGVRQTYIGYE